MPPTNTSFDVDEPRKHYWGIKRSRIDITRDEQGFWHDINGTRFDPFDASRVPILLLRYAPHCPEDKDPCLEGMFNFETDPEGHVGIAYRCFHHFWHQGTQMWSYPPRERSEFSVNTATVTSAASVEDSHAYEKGKGDFKDGAKSYNNPYDGRTSAGKAWYRGWKEASESASKTQV